MLLAISTEASAIMCSSCAVVEKEANSGWPFAHYVSHMYIVAIVFACVTE